MRRGALVALGAVFALSGAAMADEPRAYPSAEATRPLAVGSQVPDVPLRSVRGEAVALRSLVAERGALLVFYRGGW